MKIFGAKIDKGAKIHSSVKIWAPWNLEMGEYSCLGPYVDCYCADKISIGKHCTISQYTILCAATHDYTKHNMPLISASIIIEDYVWVCADVFVNPGVRIGEGAVVGVRSLLTKNVEPWTVVGGNPAKFIKKRELKESE